MENFFKQMPLLRLKKLIFFYQKLKSSGKIKMFFKNVIFGKKNFEEKSMREILKKNKPTKTFGPG